jgi:spermidine synthase
LEVLERCDTPRGEIQLQRRGREYELISNGTFLMATYNGESEKRLVRSAIDACAKDGMTLLIGGLGVGYSLGEAVHHPQTGQVTVVEIEDQVIAWNRTYLAPFSGNALSHPKTRVICADLLKWISETDETLDALCFDIDNGPDWTVFQDNESLYSPEGLKALTRLLNPGGVMSFWSASASPAFKALLKSRCAGVEEIRIEQPRHVEPDVVYIAKT